MFDVLNYINSLQILILCDNLIKNFKDIAEESSLKPQEDATKKRKVKESNQLKHRGTTSQLQEGWNNRNKPPKVDEKGAKTSGSNSVLEG